MKAGNQTLLKKNNQRAITNYIIENGPISRADLSKVLKISKPTVSANIAELLEMNLLQEIGYGEIDIGKKPMLIDFNRNFQYVLAFDFISFYTKNIVSVALCNLYCEIIFNEMVHLGEDFSKETMYEQFPKELQNILAKYNISTDRIGIFVLTAPTIAYDDKHLRFECGNGDIINLAEIFLTNFPNKIVVKNDINLAALGEKYFGVGKEANNLMFVWAGVAVGGGIILNSQLYEGSHNYGGELANTTLYDEMKGKYVFLKDFLSYEGIHEYIEFNKEDAQKSMIADKLFSRKLSLDALITAAQTGDEFCVNYAKFIAKKVSSTVCNIAFTLDLDMIIIGGEFSRFGHIFIDEFVKIFERIDFNKTEVKTPMYSNSAMYGAFKCGIDYIINNLIS
ncbi:ROK family transcriptional regulator [Paludicola sp. MB14-C6]|uniref:ROK family transcriptional regulator n=1 Tax=Paludihabitans sp. MB14-C6 TaxID=3070656 RepID=UPI0027DC6226|nr:ROK family transcriptional regulator [Paludicola sp. MB14-C6]WMJ22279.1 ROK family transcriptional regulator [Paludicola sp. MB14-C6]